MSFLNKYNKSENNTYNCSVRIGNEIYFVGSVVDSDQNFNCLITKLDLNGELIWEQSYSQVDLGFSYYQVIGCTNGDLLILGANRMDSSLNNLTRIDSEGAVVWQKIIDGESSFIEDINSINIASIGNERYVIALEDCTNDFRTVVIFVIDYYGTILHKRNISVPYFSLIMNGLAVNSQKIALYGSMESPDFNAGFILEIDFNLTQIYSKIINNYSTVSSVVYNNQELLVLSKIFDGAGCFFDSLSLNMGTLMQSQSKLYFGDLNGLKYNSSSLYVQQYGRQTTLVSKLDYQFKVLWTKQYEHVMPHPALGILAAVSEHSLLLIDGGGDSHTFGDAALGLLDLDLNSCRTILIEKILLNDKSNKFELTNIDFIFSNSLFELKLLSSPVTKLLVSKKEEVCPTIIQSDCVTDEMVCGLYNEILSIQTKCLLNPDSFERDHDFSNQIECLKRLISLLDKFNDKYPNYTFDKLFNNQSILIKKFIESPSMELYIQIWNSISELLYILSLIGNCNCEANCIANKEICDFLHHLLSVYYECLKNSEDLKDSSDFKSLKDCVIKFISLLFDFDKNHPQYKLVESIKNYLSIINHFTENPVISTYVECWNSIQNILGHLSQLGNCDCNTDGVINLEEHNGALSLQSPNFYLQAVGSLGEDSTKGIHLRWLFQGALGEKHLPKGNYAITQVNFNKSNDFVKIYRTDYSRHQFILNFKTAPNLVDDGQQTWVYRFNNNTRIIYVYFKNATKYNSVRATINPLNEPQAFIKNYGNEIIEVENKTELFFAANLTIVDITAGSILKLEGLTVGENTLISSKVLAFRKTYLSTEILQNSVVIENGRSIRIKASSCVLRSISFEFYSDFIAETNKLKKWNYFGKYALTKESVVAFNLLEPSHNIVSGKWLRYNDAAYVNTANYITKWNRPPAYPGDKNISDVIQSYIHLSEDPSNPKAIETISINLASSTVIDTEPNTDSGAMEISNLDVLRLSSLDYHIARMLGLGVLDWQDEATSGKQFIYLAEYFTFGDLEDGFGARNVHHLSMSLPTSIFDERLVLPIDIKELKPGILNNVDSQNSITDIDGFSFDGKSRFVSVFTEDLMQPEINKPFYYQTNEIDFSAITQPVYAGLEYRNVVEDEVDSGNWFKPELSNDLRYLNIDSDPHSFETVSLMLAEANKPLYLHEQKVSAHYFYMTYGINWFSRAKESTHVFDIKTTLKPNNKLLPPININPFLIRKEYPLMFSSQEEQNRLNAINTADKTLIRLTFDYNSYHELINYTIPNDTTLSDNDYLYDSSTLFKDDEEVFADEIEIYFRNPVPRNLSGKVLSFEPHVNNLLHIIHTGSYTLSSTGAILVPSLPNGTTEQNFIGSIFLMGNQQYVIHDVVDFGNGLMDFVVFKNEISNTVSNNLVATNTNVSLQQPTLTNDGLFTVVENMQNTYSWGDSTNPLALKVKVGDESIEFTSVHREMIYRLNGSGQIEKHIEKTRGFWKEAFVEEVLEDFIAPDGITQILNQPRGLYKLTFNFALSQYSHPYASNDVSVEWFNGIVRLFTESAFDNNSVSSSGPLQSRKLFKVVRTENIGTTNNLIVYVLDTDFNLLDDGTIDSTNDLIITGSSIMVNYYPGYKTYLYADSLHGLTDDVILPKEGEEKRFSIFGLRSVDYDHTSLNGDFYKSNFSVPALMYAQEIIEALTPEVPLGGLYATRPDFYGKSTYTFTTSFADNHKPYGVLFCRTTDEMLLNALYTVETINEIKNQLKTLGGYDETYLSNRWSNFFDFVQLALEENYESYPPTAVSSTNYNFPIPDSLRFYLGINNFIQNHNSFFNVAVALIDVNHLENLHLNTIIIPEIQNQSSALKLIDFIKEAVQNCFVPLTEIPVIYRFIKEGNYKPVAKKQTIRDINGQLLSTNSPDFDIAPMMKIIDNNKVQFTDFQLDGTTNTIYFYAAREISSEMKLSAYSGVLGPIKLVNSNPPEAPQLKRVIPVLENRVLGISPFIQFEINCYSELQNVKKINIYRAFNRLDATSVRTMKLVKIIDLEVENILSDDVWIFKDSFEDLGSVPYGDPIFYSITVSRRIEYPEANYDALSPTIIVVDYAESLPSKLIGTAIVENYSPESPTVNYNAELYNATTDAVLNYVTLTWNETVYKGNYHLYKMNSQGNWVVISKIIADRAIKGIYNIYVLDTNGQWVISPNLAPLQSVNGQLYLPFEMTTIGTSSLNTKTSEGTSIYHHFKVLAENTSGMFSAKENILTMYNADTYNDIGGIGVMIVQGTFIVRENNV